MTQRVSMLLTAIVLILVGAGCNKQDYSDSGTNPATAKPVTAASAAPGVGKPEAKPVQVTPMTGVPPRAPDTP